MFTLLEEYDVQATRREAADNARRDATVKATIAAVVNFIKSFQVTLTAAMDAVKLDNKYRNEVITELQKQNIAFVE